MQTPSDCTLLVTIPLTKQEFLSDLDMSSKKDFVKNWAKTQRLASDRSLRDEELWKIYSQRVVDFTYRATDEISALGANVILRAQLEDVYKVTKVNKVMTMQAHWISPKIKTEDFYDVSGFVRNFIQSEGIVARAMRSLIFSSQAQVSEFADNPAEKSAELIERINKVLSLHNTKSMEPKGISTEVEDRKPEKEIWVHLNRYALEKTFPDEIKHKCKFELCDDVYSPDEFQRSVPQDFSGVIDFTVCNSELAGRVVKGSRPCLVITNRFVTDIRRLILYKGVIKLLSSGASKSYIDATVSLRAQLLEQIGGN